MDGSQLNGPRDNSHSAPGGLSVVENPFRYGLNTYKRLLTYFIRLLNV